MDIEFQCGKFMGDMFIYSIRNHNSEWFYFKECDCKFENFPFFLREKVFDSIYEIENGKPIILKPKLSEEEVKHFKTSDGDFVYKEEKLKNCKFRTFYYQYLFFILFFIFKYI